MYILYNVSVKRNGAEFQLANHEYNLELTRFFVVTSMLSESLSQMSFPKLVPFEAFTDSIEIIAYCVGMVVVF